MIVFLSFSNFPHFIYLFIKSLEINLSLIHTLHPNLQIKNKKYKYTNAKAKAHVFFLVFNKIYPPIFFKDLYFIFKKKNNIEIKKKV